MPFSLKLHHVQFWEHFVPNWRTMKFVYSRLSFSSQFYQLQFGPLTIWTTYNLDHLQFGPLTIWTTYNLDHLQFGPLTIWTTYNLDHLQFGPLTIWTTYNLDHLQFGPLFVPNWDLIMLVNFSSKYKTMSLLLCSKLATYNFDNVLYQVDTRCWLFFRQRVRLVLLLKMG